MSSQTVLEGSVATEPNGKNVGGKFLAEFRLSFKVSQNTPTEYLTVKAWAEVGEWTVSNVRKGMLVTAIGTIRVESWTSTDGTKREKVVLSARVVAPHFWRPARDDAPPETGALPYGGRSSAPAGGGGYGRPAPGEQRSGGGYGGPDPFPDEQNPY